MVNEPQSANTEISEHRDAYFDQLKQELNEYSYDQLLSFYQLKSLGKTQSEWVLEELYDLAINDSQLEYLLALANNDLKQIIMASLNNMAAGGHKISRNEI